MVWLLGMVRRPEHTRAHRHARTQRLSRLGWLQGQLGSRDRESAAVPMTSSMTTTWRRAACRRAVTTITFITTTTTTINTITARQGQPWPRWWAVAEAA